jgi:hypothetical protein
VPDVPPLLPNEAPPSDGPNYFEPHEMSSGGIIAGFDSCQTSARKADPSLSSEQVSTYCTCTIDAFRRNVHTTGDIAKATPTMSQLQQCATAVRSGGASPFGFTSPRSTADVWKAWNGCLNAFREKDHGIYCDCFVDAKLAALKNPQGLAFSVADDRRCEMADQYWATTKNHLTVRQFKALVVPL